jgi:hypothetical protein
MPASVLAPAAGGPRPAGGHRGRDELRGRSRPEAARHPLRALPRDEGTRAGWPHPPRGHGSALRSPYAPGALLLGHREPSSRAAARSASASAPAPARAWPRSASLRPRMSARRCAGAHRAVRRRPPRRLRNPGALPGAADWAGSRGGKRERVSSGPSKAQALPTWLPGSRRHGRARPRVLRPRGLPQPHSSQRR